VLGAAGDAAVRYERPVPRRSSIGRPRLLERLRGRFRFPITVVVAPAGLGKTTLLAQAVADNELRPGGVDCWLTCTAADSMASSLLSGLCRAVGAEPPQRADKAAAAAGVATVADAMWHRAPEEIVLVLDDVHEIGADSGGAEVLTALAAALPGNGHLVLSGRPPLSPMGLARRHVAGDVLRLAEDDLLFTDDELADLASTRHVAVEQLAASHGWPALAELAASAEPGVQGAYLWEEVLARIEPARRRDLALLAHVGTFDDGLASAVLGRDVDTAGLTADVPLVASTPNGTRQIHGLWRPHLAKEVDEGEVAEARRRAGRALARAGELPRAVGLLADAGAWDDLTGVVADVLTAPDPPIPGDVVAGWLGRLPSEMTEGPLARLLTAVAEVQDDPVAATRDLQEAAEAFRAEDNPTGELACMTQLAQIAWWTERPDRLARLAARLFEMETLGDARVVPLACLGRGLIAGQLADPARVLDELDRIPAGSFAPTSQSFVDWLRSTAWSHLGRPVEALEAATRACERSNPLYAAVVESARLQALWFLGGIDHIVDVLPSLVERTGATGLRDFTSLMAATACLAHATVGRPAEAAPYLELARRSAATLDAPLVDVNLVTAEAALAIASGDEPHAARTLRGYIERSPALGTGMAALPQRRTLPLWYVLVPETRPFWDADALGPSFTLMRNLAQDLVLVRATGRLSRSARDGLPAPDVLRGLLPLPWVAELALGRVAAGDQDGWSLLEAVWPQAQPTVRRHSLAAAAAGGIADVTGTAEGTETREPIRRAARSVLVRMPVPPSDRLELRFLGPVELRRNGVLVDMPEWRRERVRTLLAHLVLHDHSSRETIAAALWPSLGLDAQSHNLRVNLAHLLRVLEPRRGERDASFFVRSHADGLRLHRGPWLDTDVWRLDDLWQRGTEADRRGSPAAALDAMQQAVALWRSEPVELASEEWAVPLVERLRLRIVGSATRAGELLLASGEPDEARRVAEVALALDLWSERIHRTIVASHASVGDNAAVERALRHYRDVLCEVMSPAEAAAAAAHLGQRVVTRAPSG
jgi:DNA-binding SARP family transcriptional activator